LLASQGHANYISGFSGEANTLLRKAGAPTNKQMLTAFGTLRVQAPTYVFEFKRNYGTTQLFFQNVTVGAGSAVNHSTNTASTTITAGTTATGLGLMQTRPYFEYQPAVGWRGFMSGNFMGAVTGTVKRRGLFDDNNGIFFEVSWTACSNGRSAVEYVEDGFTLTTTTAGVVGLSNAGSVGQQRGGASSYQDEFIYAGSDYDGNQDVVVLTYTPVDGNANCPTFGMTWKERY
jgi:hypothetical protein